MDYTFEQVAGGGYLAEFAGTLDAAAVVEFWGEVQASRPEGGFAFAVLDIELTTIPNLETWPGSPDTLELLHPVARMAAQSLDPDFRMALVSTNGILDHVIEDLTGLVTYGAAGKARADLAVRRWTSRAEALAWCRSAGDGS
ncbi:MAG: hypothetical protein AAGE98_08575 [Actinomycetota bacterium]